MSAELESTPGGKKKQPAARLSKDGKWRSFSRVPHLLQYVRSSAYFARINVRGKIIRESLDTDVSRYFLEVREEFCLTPGELKADEIAVQLIQLWHNPGTLR
jgi:hypothetical protein